MAAERNTATHVVLALAAGGTAVATAYHDLTFGGGKLMSWLWLDLGWSEGIAESVVGTLAWVGLAAALALWFRGTRAARIAACYLGLWIGLQAIAAMVADPVHAWRIPAAQATRYLTPIALLLLWRPSRRGATALLRVAAAATFLAHGLEALQHEAAFVDYLIIAGRDLLGTEPTIDAVHDTLFAIGIVDLAVAVAILSTRWRAVALYMAFWGLITAASRIVHSGGGAWHAAALRLPNAGVPLALWLLFRDSVPENQR